MNLKSLAEVAQTCGAAAEVDHDALYLLADDGITIAPSEFATKTSPGVNGKTLVSVHLSAGSAALFKTWTTKYVHSQIYIDINGKVHNMVTLQTPVSMLLISCPTQADADALSSVLKTTPVQVWHALKPGERPDESALRAALHKDDNGH